MTPAEVASMLSEDPETLLRKAAIKISGGGLARSARHHFLVMESQRDKPYPGFTTGISGMKSITKPRREFWITPRRTASGWERAANAPETTVYAVYIAMRDAGDGVGATHRMLPATGGPDLMLTSQLTGCMFGVGSDADGNVMVSHVRPDSEVKDPGLRREGLLATVNQGFAEGEAHRLYGRGVGYMAQATIVGHRKGGKWRIYAQRYEIVGPPKTADIHITDVVRLT